MLKEVEEAVRESEQALPAATVSCVYCVSRGKIHRRQSLDLLTAPMPMPISIHICASQRTAPMHPRSQHLPHADAWASVLAATPTPLFLLAITQMHAPEQLRPSMEARRQEEEAPKGRARVGARGGGHQSPPNATGRGCASRQAAGERGAGLAAQTHRARRVQHGQTPCSRPRQCPSCLLQARAASTSGHACGRAPTATPTALGACELAAFKRASLGLQNCTSRSGDTEQSNHPATGSPRVALPRDRTSRSPVVT